MPNTPKLTLPYLMPSQAQKHVILNEALRRLDAIVQASVISRTLTEPPAEPEAGAQYIVGPGASGAWEGRGASFAAWQDGAWAFIAPQTGWMAYVAEEGRVVVWTGDVWRQVAGGVEAPFSHVGVNAAPDDTNRLAVAAPATLLSHAGGGHRLAINKAAPAETASLIFQTAFSGRAEMGCAGGDDFLLKVSPDGADWTTAMQVDGATGRVILPQTPAREVLTGNRTYHVSPDGNDGNSGLGASAGEAFRTIQKAVDTIASLDLSIFAVTVDIQAGTYAEQVALKSYIGAGPVTLRGNLSDPAAVNVSVTGTCFTLQSVQGRYVLESMRLTGSAYCLYADAGSQCAFSALQFNGTGTHIYVRGLSSVQAQQGGSYEITAATFERHAYVNLPGASYAAFGTTILLPAGGCAISGEFARAQRATALNFGSCSFVNKAGATGKRFLVKENALIITGGDADYLPGTVAGEVSSGGLYL